MQYLTTEKVLYIIDATSTLTPSLAYVCLQNLLDLILIIYFKTKPWWLWTFSTTTLFHNEPNLACKP